MIIEMRFFAGVDGLSEEDAEAARQANRANLGLGVEGVKCTDVRRPIIDSDIVLLRQLDEDENFSHFMRCFFASSVEEYANGGLNIFMRRRDSGNNVGFIRVRKEEPDATKPDTSES